MFSKIKTVTSTTDCSRQIAEAREQIASAECIIIGAGAGLSTAAGLRYDGPDFEHRFADFIQKYGISDLYSSSFYPFQTEEEYWACWARHIDFIRFRNVAPLYQQLFKLVNQKDYFVITTNVDGQFRKAGFDEDRLFEVQGDYAYLQCAKGCHDTLYDNEELVKRTVLLELGVGFNTPSIIRFPFERMAASWKDTHLVRINQENTQSMLDNSHTIAIRKDISEVLLHFFNVKSN